MPRPSISNLKWQDRARGELDASLRRMHALLAPLSRTALTEPHSELMSPIIWDVAHMANYEEQWLVRALGGPALMGPDVDALYDAFAHPRATRAALPLLTPEEAFDYTDRVRAAALLRLEQLAPETLEPSVARLSKDGFVYGMVAQHAQQHLETLLATLQLMTREPCGVTGAPVERAPSHGDPGAGGEVRLEGGRFVMGTDFAWALDNERPAHSREVAPFFLDVGAVTNAAYAEFIAAGGYTRAELWTRAGFAHVQREGLVAPLFWERSTRDVSAEASWSVRRFGTLAPVVATEPVQHVCWYEADAYARWKGKRLPTELEWEFAASTSPGRHEKILHPWDPGAWTPPTANLNGIQVGPLPATCTSVSPPTTGLRQLIGDVWEWTSSDFEPYPGFVSFPYREYSEVFFGPEYKVLRGGAWGVAPVAIRTTFRNWDFPIRRQIFAGFRCARDA